MKFRKYLTFLFSIVFTLFVLGHLYYAFTGDFRLSAILHSQASYNEVIAENPTFKKEKVREILDQPYSFLGHGHQTFVFQSSDGQYVLKLFKKEFLKRDWYISLFPSIPPLKQYLVCQGKDHQSKKQKLLHGYEIAYRFDKKNSCLVYLQYQPSEPLNSSVTLIDGLGLKHQINVDDYVFAIQERIIPTRKELTQLLKADNLPRAKDRIRQLFDLYLTQYRIAIFDHDHNLIDNTGFIGERAVRQDVGKIVRDESYTNPEVYLEDLKKIAWERVDPWVGKYFPEYRDEIGMLLNEYVSKPFLGQRPKI